QVLGPYARLHVGQALLALEDHERAITAARQLLSVPSTAYLDAAARWLLAEPLEIRRDWPAAVRVWQALAARTSASPAAVHLRHARAAEQAGLPLVAREAYARIHDEWPVSLEAAEAASAMARLPQIGPTPGTFERERSRAERLFAARR